MRDTVFLSLVPVKLQMSDAQVRSGELVSNTVGALYAHPAAAAAVALAARPDGSALASGHADGDVLIFTLAPTPAGSGAPARGSGALRRLAACGCVPTALAWAAAIVVAGNNGKVRAAMTRPKLQCTCLVNI